MELFKLFGTIAINNDEANQAIIVLKNTIKTLVEETNVSYGSRLLDELEIK